MGAEIGFFIYPKKNHFFASNTTNTWFSDDDETQEQKKVKPTTNAQKNRIKMRLQQISIFLLARDFKCSKTLRTSKKIKNLISSGFLKKILPKKSKAPVFCQKCFSDDEKYLFLTTS